MMDVCCAVEAVSDSAYQPFPVFSVLRKGLNNRDLNDPAEIQLANLNQQITGNSRCEFNVEKPLVKRHAEILAHAVFNRLSGCGQCG
ncbi:MAG: hypothetical protein CMC70_03655 [Flavobacteriaceae bacterium]|nr:hypothetical protein [Flavobacteriaceae bacterium]